MLNEYLEYKAYIEAPESDSPRLQPKLLTEGFDKTRCALSGIGQILTIVARGLLSETDRKLIFDETGIITDEGVGALKETLNSWCGFDKAGAMVSAVSNEWFIKHPSANGWLRKYFIHNYKRSGAWITDKQAEECWKKWSDIWYGKLNSDNDYMAESINFSNIIAAAIQKGTLKERYCIIRKHGNSEGIRSVEDLYDHLFIYKKGTQDKIKLRTLRNIIAFRIFGLDHPNDQDEVLLQKTRLFGWYGVDSNRGKTGAWCSDRFFYKDDIPVLNSRNINKYSKFSVNRDFLDHFEFRLIDKSDAQKYEREYWIIKDTGYGDDSPLEIINI